MNFRGQSMQSGTDKQGQGTRVMQAVRGPKTAASIVLLIGLLVTAGTSILARNDGENARRKQFQGKSNEIVSKITAEVDRYKFILTSINSFFASSGEVTQPTFESFVNDLNLKFDFPAAYGVVFAANVPAGDVQNFITAQRAQIPNFSILPAPQPGQGTTPLLYIVPSGPAVPIGFDAANVPFFAGILKGATTSNEPSISPRIDLTSFGSRQNGFVVTVPILNGSIPGLASAPGQNLGWGAVPALGRDFLGAILGPDESGMEVQLYDEQVSTENLIASWPVTEASVNKEEATQTIETRLPIGSRDWILRVRALPSFGTNTKNSAPTYVGIVGSAISLLLFFLVWTLGQMLVRKRVETKLAHDATHDSLTGLPTRELFLDRVSQALARMRRQPGTAVIMFLDLDGFKVVNDSLGHDTGDFLLISISERIQSAVREYDTVARFGGDEFVILLENVLNPQAAEETAERIISAIRAPLAVEDGEVSVSSSVGVVFANSPDDEPEELITYADTAMYQAKAKGKGSYEVFSDDMRRRTANKYEIESTLRDALEKNEFRCFLQPLYADDGLTLAGYEALVRWQHPSLGLLEPGDFLRAASDTGVIVQIDRWMLEQVCRYAIEWTTRKPGGGPLTIWVNASIRHLLQADFVSHIRSTVQRYGIAEGAIGVEIDDDVLALDADAAARVVKPLKELGIQCALDDFGVGYSSTARLHQLGIDVLKLDKSLTAHVDDSDDARTMVRAVVSMARTLGMLVVAEGVERESQLRVLRAEGVDTMQGFLLGRPEPAEDVLQRTALRADNEAAKSDADSDVNVDFDVDIDADS